MRRRVACALGAVIAVGINALPVAAAASPITVSGVSTAYLYMCSVIATNAAGVSAA